MNNPTSRQTGFVSRLLAFLLGASVLVQASPRNIILFIGDGMGPEQVRAANYYNGGPLSFENLPYQGEVTTYSASSSVTDSAAAATAMATGIKVNNGVISLAIPGDSSELETMLEFFQVRGKKTGLLTTAHLTHATPAAFGAHETNRGNYAEIGSDYLTQTRPNLLFGGGGNGLEAGPTASAGYTVATDTTGFHALDPATARLAGLFGSGYMPYEADYLSAPETYPYPHLSEMVTKALDALEENPGGFFLMVEAGRIDHACHDNLLEEAVHETLELGNAVQAALDWMGTRTDTLLVVTSDHETGGLSVTQHNGANNYPSASFSSTGHTGVNVPVYATGPHAAQVAGVMDNTDFVRLAGMESSVTLLNPAEGTVITSSPHTFVAEVCAPDGLASATLFLNEATEPLIFSGSAQIDDAQITADTPDTSGGSGMSINVDGATPHAHGLIRFNNLVGSNPGQVPPGASITSATLQVNCTNFGDLMTAYRLLEDWDEATATWNSRSSGVPWLDPGADGTSSHAPTALPADLTVTGWRSIDLTAFVQDWADGAENHGIVLIDSGTNGMDFDSSESPNSPVLTVSYAFNPTTRTVTFDPGTTSGEARFLDVPLLDGIAYTWNCRLTDDSGGETWAPASGTFTFDTHYPDIPILVAPADGAADVSAAPTLEVTVADPDPGETLDVTFFGRPKVSTAMPFTIVVLPDTQYYSQSYPATFTAQTQWIADNQATENIVFVTHEGDIVQVWDDTNEWDNARTSLDVLKTAGVPFGLAPGNHDQEGSVGSSSYYNTYTASYFDPVAQPTLAETFADPARPGDENDNSAHLFSAGGIGFLLLQIEVEPSAAVLGWANGLIQANLDRKVVITTHSYLKADGSYDTSGIDVWDTLIAPHPNVCLVLCGHYSGETYRIATAGGPGEEHEVHQILANYQALPEGGQGYLRIMRFVPAEDRVYVQTYSPLLDQYQTDADSEFVLPLPMGGFEELGTVTGVASGANALFTWSDLAIGRAYEWTALAGDPTGRESLSPTWTFTTSSNDITAPVISAVAATPADVTATITWTTDEAATSMVEYRILGETDWQTVSDPALTTSHSLTLDGLTAEYAYEYQVTSADTSGNSASAPDQGSPYQFTTLETNLPPVADSQAVTLDEDGSIGIILTSSDPNGDPLSYVISTAPASGSLSGSSPSLTYTPNPDFAGSDSFQFIVNDGEFDSPAATVTITVNPINDDPTAPTGLAATAGDGQVSLSWQAATDPDGDSLTYTVVRNSAVIATGVIGTTYLDSSVTNDLTYSYVVRASDGTVESPDSNQATATPSVPDTTPPGISALTAAPGLDGTSATISWTTDEDADSLVEFGIGSLSQSLDNQALTTSHSLTLTDLQPDTTYSYRVTSADASGNSSTSTIGSFKTNAVVPTADGQAVTLDEDDSIGITLTGSDPNGEPLSYIISTAPASGSLSGSAPGLTYTPNPDFAGSDSFQFIVNDGVHDSAPATVTITVNPINDPPTAPTGLAATAGDGQVSLSWQSATDPDGDSLTYTVVRDSAVIATGVSGTTYLDTSVTNGPTYTYMVRASDGTLESPDSNQATATPLGIDPNAYVIQNPVLPIGTLGGDDYASLEPAVAGSQTLTEVRSGRYGRCEAQYMLQTVADPATIDSITLHVAHSLTSDDGPWHVRIWNGSTWTSLGDLPVGTATVSFPVDQATALAPDGTIQVAIVDGGDQRKENYDTLTLDTLYAEITLGTPNSPPTADDQTRPANEDAPLGITLTASDPEGDALDFTITNAPDHGVLSGTAPNLTYTPAENYNGSDSFQFTVSDGRSTSDPATVTINVSPVNDAPVATAQAVSTDLATAVGITLDGSDVDGDSLVYSITAPPSNGTTGAVNGNAVTYTPNAGFVGNDSFSYTVDDGNGGTDTAAVTVTVTDPSSTPTIHVAGITVEAIRAGKNWKGTATISVVDRDGLPVAGATVTGSWTFNAGAIGSGSGVTDTGGAAALTSDPVKKVSSGTFTFTVTDVTLAGSQYDASANVETSDSASF